MPFFKTSLAVAVATSTIVLAAPAQAATQTAPEFVKIISDKLISRLVQDKAAYKKDPRVLVKVVEQNIEPYVDFAGFSKGVMGKYYRRATPQQKASFEQTFRRSLINSYAKYLGEYDNQSYSIRPFVAGSDPKKAIVTMDFKTGDGQSVPISYQLVDYGQWKVRNVKVAGIDIGLTFRKQFANAVEANKNNLGLAIKNFIPKAENQ